MNRQFVEWQRDMVNCPGTDTYFFRDRPTGKYRWMYLYQVWRAQSGCRHGPTKEVNVALMLGPGFESELVVTWEDGSTDTSKVPCESTPPVGVESRRRLPWPDVSELPPTMWNHPKPDWPP